MMTAEYFSVPRGLMDGRFAAAMTRNPHTSAAAPQASMVSFVERIRARLGMTADASVADMLAEVDKRTAAKATPKAAASRMDPGADQFSSTRAGAGVPPLTAAEAALMRAAGWEA